MLYIFDMGGVVTTTADSEVFERTASAIGISVEKLYEYSGYGTENDLFRQLDNGFIDSKKYWELFSERSGIKVNCDWWRIMFHPKLNMETVQLIKDLKACGHRVVCGTNTIQSHYDNHSSRGDYDIFDMTYTSIHMGVSKPDPNFWETILYAENISRSETFFTDDRQENCDAAEKLGIKSHLFTTADDLRKAWL